MPSPSAGLAVVAGLHDPDSGRPVLAQALDLAARLNGELIVAHVEEIPLAAGLGLPASGMAGPPAVPLAQEQAAAELELERIDEAVWVQKLCAEVAGELGLEDVPWSHRSGLGEAGRALAELADEVDAYCVVVGSRGEGMLAALGRWFRPSVSRSVLRARCVPVLVVPSPEDDD